MSLNSSVKPLTCLIVQVGSTASSPHITVLSLPAHDVIGNHGSTLKCELLDLSQAKASPYPYYPKSCCGKGSREARPFIPGRSVSADTASQILMSLGTEYVGYLILYR